MSATKNIANLPFLSDDNIDSVIDYDNFQIGSCAAIACAYYGERADLDTVLNALLVVDTREVFIKDSRENRLTAAIHGWTLEELTDAVAYNTVFQA